MNESHLYFFGCGVLLGLAAAVWVGISGWRRRRDAEAEVRRLRAHLHDHMEITHEGTRQQKHRVEQLRMENENLRVTLKAWQQRPDRRELRVLQVYDHAVHQLLANAPGFSPHWENALREADRHVAQIDSGLIAFARRLVMPPPQVRDPRERDSRERSADARSRDREPSEEE
jgi:hypothetical protein